MERPRPEVVNNTVASRFEIRESDAVAFLDYLISGGRLNLVHTEVPAAFQGRGYAGELARAGLEYAQERGLRVVPSCSFVAGYIARHPEYQPLVDADP